VDGFNTAGTIRIAFKAEEPALSHLRQPFRLVEYLHQRGLLEKRRWWCVASLPHAKIGQFTRAATPRRPARDHSHAFTVLPPRRVARPGLRATNSNRLCRGQAVSPATDAKSCTLGYRLHAEYETIFKAAKSISEGRHEDWVDSKSHCEEEAWPVSGRKGVLVR